ncbi:MAG: hypothetical protein HGA77_02030 [Chlorobiaceae bacterium]|nr:hypothetical protein [Chlorobiaceae bacterium]
MQCVNCFFSTENQSELKRSTFGIDRFELRIDDYKAKYLAGLSILVPVEKCNCQYRLDDPDYLKWTSEFLSHTKANTDSITKVFDLLREIYVLYISKSQKHAADLFWTSIQLNRLLGHSENPQDYSQLLFRARKKSANWDSSDPKNYFHIPFNLRRDIANQRFSVSGQPMLYFGNSIHALVKELDLNCTDLEIAGFLPSFSIFYYHKVNEIKNYLFQVLVNSLPVIFAEGSKIDFYDNRLEPNATTIKRDLQRSIMTEILTFPTKDKGSFVEEYVLPQLFTSLLIENDYKGVLFPSTKDYSDITGMHQFSQYNHNLAVFVDYDATTDYDMSLLNSFDIILLDGTEAFSYSSSQVLALLEEVGEKNRKSNGFNNNDHLYPMVKAKLHIEYMESAVLGGQKYYETKEGKIELEFFAKLSNMLLDRIKTKV